MCELSVIDKSSTWELLHQLPKYPRLAKALHELKDPVWTDLLDSRRVFRLLYVLELLSTHMAPPEGCVDPVRLLILFYVSNYC